MRAYCWRNGRIEFGNSVPQRARLIVKGPSKIIRQVITAKARHSRNGQSLLVPGIPEAIDDLDAALSLMEFQARVLEGVTDQIEEAKRKKQFKKSWVISS